MTDHIVLKDTECEQCQIGMPKGFSAVEDDNGNLFCSASCAEAYEEYDDDSHDDDL